MGQETNPFKLVQEFVFWVTVIIMALIVGVYVPMVGLLTAGVLAAPIVIFTLRYGTLMGNGLLLAIAGALFIILGKTVGIGFLCEFGFLSQALVFGFRNKLRKEKIVLITFLVTLTAMFFFVAGTAAFNQVGNISNYIKKQIDESISQTIRAYDNMEMKAEQKEVLKETAETVKAFLLKTYPGLYASITLLLVVANYFATKIFLLKMGYPLPDLTPFNTFMFPEYLVWGFIISAGILASTLVSLVQAPIVNTIGLNLTLLFTTFYLVQGLAILFFWGQRSRLPLILKWMGFILLIIQPFFLLLIAGSGLFDIWFDFRKIKQQPIT